MKLEDVHENQLLGQIGLAQKQVEVSVHRHHHPCMADDLLMILQRWVGDRLLMEQEAKALAEEDYELVEQLSRQLDATGVQAEQDIASAGLAVVSL